MGSNNYREIWQYAMNQIYENYKNKGQETEFQLWFNMQYVEDSQNTIIVSVPSEFMWQSMLKKGNIKEVIEKIEELTGQKNIQLSYIIKENETSPEKEKKTIAKSEIKQNIPKENEKQQTEITPVIPIKKPKHPQLREDFIFDTFVQGENNNFAYNAALAVAKEPGKLERYNPILLYGGSGLGKTHLMQSIGNFIYTNNPESLKISYTSAESFTNEFTASLSSKNIDQFKLKYRNLDILLLDDIHFLQGKKATQEELFYTFNALRDKNKQMIFTCDRPIKELKDFWDRIQTGFLPVYVSIFNHQIMKHVVPFFKKSLSCKEKRFLMML